MLTGGSYIIDPVTGERTRVEEPTRSDPAGDMPRTAEGEVIGADGLPVPPPAELATPAEPPPAETPPASGFPFGAGGGAPAEEEH